MFCYCTFAVPRILCKQWSAQESLPQLPEPQGTWREHGKLAGSLVVPLPLVPSLLVDADPINGVAEVPFDAPLMPIPERT